jgi:hypothetical protein
MLKHDCNIPPYDPLVEIRVEYAALRVRYAARVGADPEDESFREDFDLFWRENLAAEVFAHETRRVVSLLRERRSVAQLVLTMN